MWMTAQKSLPFTPQQMKEKKKSMTPWTSFPCVGGEKDIRSRQLEKCQRTRPSVVVIIHSFSMPFIAILFKLDWPFDKCQWQLSDNLMVNGFSFASQWNLLTIFLNEAWKNNGKRSLPPLTMRYLFFEEGKNYGKEETMTEGGLSWMTEGKLKSGPYAMEGNAYEWRKVTERGRESHLHYTLLLRHVFHVFVITAHPLFSSRRHRLSGRTGHREEGRRGIRGSLSLSMNAGKEDCEEVDEISEEKCKEGWRQGKDRCRDCPVEHESFVPLLHNFLSPPFASDDIISCKEGREEVHILLLSVVHRARTNHSAGVWPVVFLQLFSWPLLPSLLASTTLHYPFLLLFFWSSFLLTIPWCMHRETAHTSLSCDSFLQLLQEEKEQGTKEPTADGHRYLPVHYRVKFTHTYRSAGVSSSYLGRKSPSSCLRMFKKEGRVWEKIQQEMRENPYFSHKRSIESSGKCPAQPTLSFCPTFQEADRTRKGKWQGSGRIPKKKLKDWRRKPCNFRKSSKKADLKGRDIRGKNVSTRVLKHFQCPQISSSLWRRSCLVQS